MNRGKWAIADVEQLLQPPIVQIANNSKAWGANAETSMG